MKKRIEETKKESKQANKLLIGAVIATVVMLVLGLLLGNYLATSRIEKFQSVEESLLVQLIAIGFRSDMVENVCNIEWKSVWDQKIKLGQMLTSLEIRFGKGDPRLDTKKEIYELIEIKIIEMLNQIKDKCHEDISIILFFYTNERDDPKGSFGGSEDQGLVLDQVYLEHNQNNQGTKVYTFVFNINSKNAATNALISKYNITNVPALVINDKAYGYLVKADIEKLL